MGIPPNVNVLVRAFALPQSLKSALQLVRRYFVLVIAKEPGGLKDKPGLLYACIMYRMLKDH